MLTQDATPEGLTRLTRLARERGNEGERWLERVFEKRLDTAAEPALDVAVETGDPVGQVLARQVARRGALDLSTRLVELCDSPRYRHVVALRELALVVTQLLVAHRRRTETQREEMPAATFAILLNNLSNRLRDLGRAEEAVEVSAEAVELFRSLDARYPGRHQLGLVGTLFTRAALLGRIGQHPAALELLQKAVSLARRPPGSGQSALASCLNNLGNTLSRLGRPEDAIEPLSEAVAIRRRLHTKSDNESTRELAGSSHSLGSALSILGRWSAAAEAFEEALDLRKRLVEKRPEAFEPELAESLDHLAQAFAALGRPRRAIGLAEDAVKRCRALSVRRPEVFGPVLAMSLTNLGNLLATSGATDRALPAIAEAAALYRRLTARRPDVSRADLGRAILDLTAVYLDLERWPEAHGVAQEATEIFSELEAEASGEAIERELASSFSNLAAACIGIEHWKAAVDAARRAVSAFQTLLRRQPAVARPGLVTSRQNLALSLRGLGRKKEAVQAAEAGLLSCDELDEGPEGLEARAHSLDLLGLLHDELGRHAEALRASRAAVDLRRDLARSGGKAARVALASTLINHAHRLRNDDRHRHARAAAREALQILEPLRATHPTIYRDESARGQEILSSGIRHHAHP